MLSFISSSPYLEHNLIIILINFSPLKNFNFHLTDLDSLSNNIKINYPDHPTVIGGDFNTHVGLLNNMNNLTEMGNFLHKRDTFYDKKPDDNCKKLCELLETHEFYLFNGRSNSDFPGHLTYIKNNSSSTIDLIWCSNLCYKTGIDMKVTLVHCI